MTTTANLRQSDFIPAAEAAMYTALGKTIIDKCSSSAVLAGSVTVRIVESGGTSATKHQQAKKTFLADDSYTWPELVGQTLETGDVIYAAASAANAITLRISGRKVT